MNPFVTSILTLIERDLNKLEEEIKLYPTEESLWEIYGTAKNPVSIPCL